MTQRNPNKCPRGRVSLATAAILLRLDYQRVRGMALRGELGNVLQLPNGRYYLLQKTVQALATQLNGEVRSDIEARS